MSRNYQMHDMARNEAYRADVLAERAEMRRLGFTRLADKDDITPLTCEGCWQTFHPDAVDGSRKDGWCCTECETYHEGETC